MRLIDADALMDEANSDGAYGYVNAKQISEAPTVGAVPVVRCAKCEHWVKNDDGQCVCALFEIANSYGEPVVTKPDDFCSYGKRKGCAD